MSNCENFQIEISALIDDECDGEDLLPLIDHLALCPDCRRVYQEMRTFQINLDSTQLPAAAAIPVPEKVSVIHRLPRFAQWAVPLAATIALIVGLTQSGLNPVQITRIDPDMADNVIPIVLEQNKGEMTDVRFVELAVELLSSDQRYQQTMASVLEQVWHTEGHPEDPYSQGDEDLGRGSDRQITTKFREVLTPTMSESGLLYR